MSSGIPNIISNSNITANLPNGTSNSNINYGANITGTNVNNGNYFLQNNSNSNFNGNNLNNNLHLLSDNSNATIPNSFPSNNTYIKTSTQNLVQSDPQAQQIASNNLILGSEKENKPYPPNHPYPNNTNPMNSNLLVNQSLNENHNSFYQSNSLTSVVSDNGGVNNSQSKLKRFSHGSLDPASIFNTPNLNFIQQLSKQNSNQVSISSDASNILSNNSVEQGQV